LSRGAQSGLGLPEKKIFLHQVFEGDAECQNYQILRKMLSVT
jgi:hypothetical protein